MLVLESLDTLYLGFFCIFDYRLPPIKSMIVSQCILPPQTQSRKIAFAIPVKPYIKKYLLCKYGARIGLNHKSTIGFILSRVFLKNTVDNSRRLDDSFSDSISVDVAKHDVFKNGYRTLTEKSTLDFNNAVHQLFIDELCINVQLYCELQNCSINAAISKFVDSYGITEADFKLESLQKAVYREKLKKDAFILSYTPSA